MHGYFYDVFVNVKTLIMKAMNVEEARFETTLIIDLIQIIWNVWLDEICDFLAYRLFYQTLFCFDRHQPSERKGLTRSLFPIFDQCDITTNTKHLYNICTMLGQRRRRWSNIVQMLYKCLVFNGKELLSLIIHWDGDQREESVVLFLLF